MENENVQNQEGQVQENTQEVASQAAVSIPGPEQLKNMTKDDLLKLKQDLLQYPAAIEQAIAEKVQAEEAEVKTYTQQFREKHGISLWVALVGGGYIAWQVGVAIARALGVI